MPNDAPIESLWPPDAFHGRPRSPNRRIAPAMHPLIPRAGLGAEATDFVTDGYTKPMPVSFP